MCGTVISAALKLFCVVCNASALITCRERLEMTDILYKLHHAVHLMTYSNGNWQQAAEKARA
jgi:hypothetical protein